MGRGGMTGADGAEISGWGRGRREDRIIWQNVLWRINLAPGRADFFAPGDFLAKKSAGLQIVLDESLTETVRRGTARGYRLSCQAMAAADLFCRFKNQDRSR